MFEFTHGTIFIYENLENCIHKNFDRTVSRREIKPGLQLSLQILFALIVTNQLNNSVQTGLQGAYPHLEFVLLNDSKLAW